jgi:putative transposase
MEYRRGSHTVTAMSYHLVWVTKYRYQILVGDVKFRVRELVRQICAHHEVNIVRGHVSKDHVHLLVATPPQYSASYLMQKIKGRTSRVLQQEFPILRKRYWGQHLWARGYFSATVGQVTDEMIANYIASHNPKSPDDSFTLEP